MEILMGIDIGTSHCKAGLFRPDGAVLRICTRAMRARRSPEGYSFYPVDEVRSLLAEVIREALSGLDTTCLAGLGVASMAEAGLVVERASGDALTPVFPWYDPCTSPQADWLRRQDDPLARFCKSGIYPGFKVSLARLAWLKQRQPRLLHGAAWLSMADAAVFWLCGAMQTDYSLAGRTYAFRIDRLDWDRDWLLDLGFPPDLFPPARPAGEIAGRVLPEASAWSGLPAGLPVAIAGHDHIAASTAAGAMVDGTVFNSMGTAESLQGLFDAHPLGKAEFESGLSFGCHLAPGKFYWLGGLSTSGGSLDWLRRVLDERGLTYDQLGALLAARPEGPSGILFFPYLAGAGSPCHDPRARAAFIGLASGHSRADLAWAVLEGVAYEVEMMRRAGEGVTGQKLASIRAAGGGTRLPAWMQVRADVTGCRYAVLAMDEATLLGAALVGGVVGGLYREIVQAQAALAARPEVEFYPDPARSAAYRRWFEQGYLALQEPLRKYYQSVKEMA